MLFFAGSIVSSHQPHVLVERTYVDTPELLYRIEADDFLEKLIPVVSLSM